MNFKNQKSIFVLSKKILDKIIINSRNKLGRFRQNLHKSYTSKIQEMIIAFDKDSYVEPHYFTNKKTIFRLIKGKFLINIFYNSGKIKSKIYLKNKNDILIIPNNTIYDIKALISKSVVHELMDGPFNKKLFKKNNK